MLVTPCGSENGQKSRVFVHVRFKLASNRSYEHALVQPSYNHNTLMVHFQC